MPPVFHPVRPVPESFVADLFAVGDALFAATPEDEPRVRWVVGELCDVLRRAGSRAYNSYRVGLFLTTWLAPLAVRKFGPLKRLSRSDRIEALQKFEDGPLGAPFFAVKSMLCIIYYEHPEAAARIQWNTRALLEKFGEGASR